jgi:hypothetical protein
VKVEAASINPADWKIQKGMLRPSSLNSLVSQVTRIPFSKQMSSTYYKAIFKSHICATRHKCIYIKNMYLLIFLFII